MISIYEYGAVPNDRIFARQDPVSDVRDAVAEILVTVQRDGDAALRNYAQRFDHASLTALEVSPAEIDDAMAQISPEFAPFCAKRLPISECFTRNKCAPASSSTNSPAS